MRSYATKQRSPEGAADLGARRSDRLRAFLLIALPSLVVATGAADAFVRVTIGGAKTSTLILVITDLSLAFCALRIVPRLVRDRSWLPLGILGWAFAVICLGVLKGMSHRGYETGAVFVAGATVMVLSGEASRSPAFASRLVCSLRVFVVVWDAAYVAHLISSHLGGAPIVSPRPWALLGPLAVAICVSAIPSHPVLASTAALIQIGLVGVSGSRTAFAVTAIAALLTAIALSHIRARAIAAGTVAVVLAGAVAVLWLPPLHDRLFLPPGVGDRGLVIAGHALNTSGRAAFWSKTWDDYLHHPWLGGGLGRAGDYLHRVAPPIEHPLNDYLRLLDDTGVIAFGLVAIIFVALTVRVWRLARHVNSPTATTIASIAATALPAVALLALTDNPIVYYWVVIPTAAVVGFTAWHPRVNSDASTTSSS